MKPLTLMVVAGEASGDQLAAELVTALRRELTGSGDVSSDLQPLRTELAPRFIGAGGPRLTAAGVDLLHDLTQHTVFGITGVIRNYFKFRRLRDQLAAWAVRRQPEVIIGVDYSGFNRALASAIRRIERRQSATFGNWHPKLVQFVSPQVWASRADRVYSMQRDYDLVLSIFPFEKAWYARRVPHLRVEFVGHPIADRHPSAPARPAGQEGPVPLVLLLPGSRRSELTRHLPVIVETARRLISQSQARLVMVLPDNQHADLARAALAGSDGSIVLQTGGLSTLLPRADMAIASSGTVTLECAWFGVPTVVFYMLSRPEYKIGRRIVKVPFIAMPNLLAGEEVFPEFIQDTATAENLAGAALDLLNNMERRNNVRVKLAKAVASLGGPGATRRAAQAILSLLPR